MTEASKEYIQATLRIGNKMIDDGEQMVKLAQDFCRHIEIEHGICNTCEKEVC